MKERNSTRRKAVRRQDLDKKPDPNKRIEEERRSASDRRDI